MIYEVILYDAVAGGAGYVRRLVTDDCDVFQKVIQKAIDITKGCNCTPSCYNCLRNYYNQTIHDKLNRVEAYTFLEHYHGEIKILQDDEFESQHRLAPEELQEDKIRFLNGYSCVDYQNWNEFSPMIPEEYINTFEDMDMLRVPIPSESYSRIELIGAEISTEVMFIWKDTKILVFDAEQIWNLL